MSKYVENMLGNSIHSDLDDFICGAVDGCVCDGCEMFREAIKNPKPGCLHQWMEYEGQGTTLEKTDVKCSYCGVFGERDEKTKEVYWPCT